jgi:hypothetical protein
MSIEIGTGADLLGDDILRGAKEIGRFIDEPPKRVFYLIARGYLPVGRIGTCLTASKTVLREHYAKVTRGPAAEPPPQPPAPTSDRRRSAELPPPRRKRHRRKREDLPAEAG